MKIYDVSRLPSSITLGWDGENNWRPIAFDCSAFLTGHPNAVVTLWLLPKGEAQAFPVALERDSDTVVWTPLNEEMTAERGQLQIVVQDGTDVGKSRVIDYAVHDSLVGGADHPAEAPSWAVQVVADVTEQADRAEAAAESIDPESLEQTISEAIAAYLEEHPVEVIETDPTVPAWAKNPTKPTYSAEEVGALPDSYTPPVTSVNGKTGAVNLEASDVHALPDSIVIPAAVTEQDVAGWGFTKNTGTYSKPSGGIPASDLAADMPFFTLPEGGQSGQALISDGAGGAEWGQAGVEVDTTLTQAGKAADAAAVGEILGFVFNNTADKWENKGFDNGVEYDAPDRIKLIGYIPEEITHIKTDGSYSFLLYAFDESDQYIGYWTGSGFGTSGFVYESDLDIPDTNYNLAVVVKNNDSNTISPSDCVHVHFDFASSGLTGDVEEIQSEIVKIKDFVGYQESTSATYSYNDLLAQISEQYSNVYVSQNSVGLSLEDALGSSQGDTTKIFVIPCRGGGNVSYPVFKSSYDLGSAFLDSGKIVISQLPNSTLATGTQVDVTAPASAKYFVFVMSPSLLNMSSNVSVTVTTEEEITDTDVLNDLVKAVPRFLPYLASLASDSSESLCLCGIKTKYQSNTLPFEEGFLFHKINSTEKKFYYGTTLHNAAEVGTVPFDPKLYFYGISPTDGRVICGRRETTGSLYVWDGTTTTELFATATRKPYGWLYTTGIEFVKDSNNVEHCVFGEYAHAASAPLYVWRGTYPYTSESDWERVLTINSVSDSQTVGSIRHFHQVRRDPWTDVLYLTSGDNKNQLNWWYSTDYGATWTLLLNDANVGWEDHVARCCNLIFTEDFIYWGSDFGENHSLNRVARGSNGIIDPSMRVKLADLPWGYATNSLCYVEHLNALFCYDRHDGYTQFSSLYGKPLNVNVYLIDIGVLKTVCAMPTKPEWGGHRGKAYVNYTNGQNPSPALGFSADTPCIFENIGASAGLGTLFYDV